MFKRNNWALCFIIFCSIACTENKVPQDFLSSNIDTSINPADDFFLYANGNWINQNPIPADESAWGIGNLVQEEIYLRLRTINEKAIETKSTMGSVNQKIADFWQTGMDSVKRNREGLSPIQQELDAISAIQSLKELMQTVADFHQKGIHCLFDAGVYQDAKNSNRMMFHLWQGGLGMPNRDYYFNTDEKSQKVRAAYEKYVAATFQQIGNDSISALNYTNRLLQLETALAKSSKKLADLRDPYANYNKMSLPMLHKLTPNIDWESYLKTNNLAALQEIIVGQPGFYTSLEVLLHQTPLDDWKNYLRFHLIQSYAGLLDDKTYSTYFQYTKSLNGASKPRPRWKRILNEEENILGEALGELFVKEYFNDNAKKRYTNLVETIRASYKERILKLTWMSDSTKIRALDKLQKLTYKVGYPNVWKDFSQMKIDTSSFVVNVMHANTWWYNYMIKKLGKPVDRTEWDMSPQTYNAYYNPSNNEIVLPAGIFTVPGMRDEDVDDAFVYGYAGASTIGHEITHGFDDQGRQYDAEGNLKSWWLPNDSAQFVQRTQRIIKEFNAFIPVDTLHVNGEATQGENIADLGGLLIGLDALKKTELYTSGKKIHGQTAIQRYFTGYAYGWMIHERKEKLAAQLMQDVHAPAKERVNGPMKNIPEFYEAFNVKAANKMFTPDSLRVSIW